VNWVTLLILFFISQSVTARVGFESGDHFFVHSVYAEVRVHCHTPSENRTIVYDCHESVLLPTEVDFFNGPRGTRANELILLKIQDPKSKRVAEYNPQIGQSRNQINLWMRSVFQRPLLNLGANLIEFELFENRVSVGKGTFSVLVSRGSSLNCTHTGVYQSNKIEDCQYPQKFCEDFIKVNNYCRP